MTTNIVVAAAQVLKKCNAYNPYLPEASEDTVLAWAEHFDIYKLDLADLLAGVKIAFRDHGGDFRPLPKDISDAARAHRRDRTERESTAVRQAREDQRDAELANRKRLASIVNGVVGQKEIPNA